MLLADLAEFGLLTWDRVDDTIEAGHRYATKNRFRFYSYGDAMWLR